MTSDNIRLQELVLFWVLENFHLLWSSIQDVYEIMPLKLKKEFYENFSIYLN
jgi:hypothetical protein